MREVTAFGPHGLQVAAFDFDGTLTRGDTLLPFLAAGLGLPRFAWALLRTSPWLVGHALRLVRNDIAKARLFAACLSELPADVAAQWAERWAREQLPRQLRGPQDPVIRQLAWHRALGHCCVMVSASPDIYLAHAAAALGFDALVCTQMEKERVPEGPSSVGRERLTGRMRSPNCHGQQKVIRLQAWLAGRHDASTLAGMTLYAYGDTAGDKPMLKLAQHAWYRGKPMNPGDGFLPSQE